MNIIYLIDFNCPYSYIGLKRLQKTVKNLNVDAEWEMKAFELELSTGKRHTLSTTEKYAEKYELSMEEASQRISQIEQMALDDGFEINFKDMLLTSSKDALRLCKFAQNMHPEIALKLVEEIFYSNMVKNENIADIKVLSEIAISCGLKENETKKILENNYYNIEMFLDKEEALSHGITATPCFILTYKGERLIVPGAYSRKEFETALKDLTSGNIENKTF